MRINEITNAKEQLALWKLVSDNIWQAIAVQAQQQKQTAAISKTSKLSKTSKPTTAEFKSRGTALAAAAAKDAVQPNAQAQQKVQQQQRLGMS